MNTAELEHRRFIRAAVKELGTSASVQDVAYRMCEQLPGLPFGTAVMYGLRHLCAARKRRKR